MDIQLPKEQMGATEGVRHRSNPTIVRPNASANMKGLQMQPSVADRKAVASGYFSIGTFLVLVCLTASLLVLPLVLPPLPPPPSLLLLLPVCLLLLLILLAFMPSDVRTMASSYL